MISMIWPWPGPWWPWCPVYRRFVWETLARALWRGDDVDLQRLPELIAVQLLRLVLGRGRRKAGTGPGRLVAETASVSPANRRARDVPQPVLSSEPGPD